MREFRFRQLTMIYGTVEQYKHLIVQLRNDLLVTEPRHATEEPVIADSFLRADKNKQCLLVRPWTEDNGYFSLRRWEYLDLDKIYSSS